MAGALAVLLAITLAPAPAMAAPTDTDGDIEIGVSKYIESPTEGTLSFAPGESFTYTIRVNCSALDADGCLNAAMKDVVPEPLELQSTSVFPGGISRDTSDLSTNTVAIAFTQTVGPGQIGMTDSTTANISVLVKIPDDITWLEAQALGDIVNTATFTADASRALSADDTSTVRIVVPDQLAADATKAADDNMGGTGRPIPAVPGKAVDFAIGGGNASNRPVDSLTITDPGAGSTNLNYLDFTSVGPVAPPAGADQFVLSYINKAGATSPIGTFDAPIASVPLGGIDLTDVAGFTFVFSNSSGAQLPPAADADDYAGIGIGAATNDLVSALPQNVPLLIHNVVDVTVAVGADTAFDNAAADVTITNVPPGVVVAKQYARDTLLGGQSTTATIRADNGGKDVVEMVIADPIAGQPNLREQGLIFTGFGDEIQWPADASSATITYTSADGTTEVLTADARDSLPAATNPAEVVGFAITFSGSIVAGAYASLPFEVTALPVEGTADVVSTNTVTSTVIDADGVEVNDENEAVLTRRPVSVQTNVVKSIIKDEIYSRPGASSTVQISGAVAPESSIGSEYLIIQDPIAPAASPSDFWNHFDLQSVGPIDVPPNATMTPEYWDGTQWVSFLPQPVTPGTTWSFTVADALEADVSGIRFVFEPAIDGELLEPGFNVLTYFKVALREELRDGTGPAAGNELLEPIANDAQSAVFNPETGQGVVTAESEDSIARLPITGEGPDFVNKSWTPEDVVALSAADTTATLSWGTLGLPLDRMTITDPSSAETVAVKDSVYDAFDLTRIPAIDSSTDPGMRFDQVYVQRRTEAGAWVALSDGFTAASPSVGSYPGYTLSAAERADTLGIRFVFSERPDRATVITNVDTDPAVGSGVAETQGRDRNIRLHLTLRDYLRSNPTQPVLGTNHEYGYNTGTPGYVRNTVNATGIKDDVSYSANDEAYITILDRPQNVGLTKRFVDYDPTVSDPANQQDVTSVAVPSAATPQAGYPLVTALIVATNQSDARVGTLEVIDPDVAQSGTILEHFNLYRIADITVPQGADAALSRVRLSPAIGGKSEFTLAEAAALTPAELTDAVSITVSHSGGVADDGTYSTMIASQAATSIRLEYQLRQNLRGTQTPVAPSPGSVWPNHAIFEQTRPGANAEGPLTEAISAIASDDLTIVLPTYGVTTAKSITPATRLETTPRDGYQIGLRGQPSGTVRSTEMSLTDLTPTFWNAFDLQGFSAITLPAPVNRLRIDYLTGVEYSLDDDATLVQTCATETNLEDCWTNGTELSPASGRVVSAAQQLAALPSGVELNDVQGLRFTYTRADGANWERPSNPTVVANFRAERRELLRYGTDGATDTAVPTTRPGLLPAPGETSAGVFTDLVTADAYGSWLGADEQPWFATASDDANTTVTHVKNGISVSKVHNREQASTNRDTFAPGAEIPYAITIKNTGGWPITGLTLVDQVATDANGPMLVEPSRDVDDAGPIYTATRNGTTLAGFSATMDASGQILFTLPDGFVFAPNDTLLITASLVFRQSPAPIQPGTRVDNGITATSDRFFDTCDYTLQAQAQSRTEAVAECASRTEATPVAASPIATTKAVKGIGAGQAGATLGDPNYDDLGVLGLNIANPTTYCATPNAGDGYYRSPCVPITRPGSIEQWRLEFTNNGNIPMSKLVSIDVLPALGDTGVTLSGNRLSRWHPIFTGSLTASFAVEGGALATFYSTVVPNRACNESEILYLTGGGGTPACQDEVANQRPTMWLPYDESLSADVKASIKALKFVGDFSASPLLPNEKVQLAFRSQTPWFADRPEAPSSGVDPIAWNSFASGSVGINVGTNVQSAVVEPRKVGIAMATGQLRLAKTVDGVEESWGVDFPSDYLFTLSCVSGGQPVPLVGPTGLDMSQVRLSSDGTPLSYNSGTGAWGIVNLPLYAECSVSENADDPSSQGAFVSYEPAGADGASGALEALRFQFGSNVANPADTGSPDDATISALNTYLPGGFEVTKAVNNGGAESQDGTPISYGSREFTFDAVCTFLDTTVLDQTFSLTSGGTQIFSNLPAGAECEVVETDTQDAADTTVVVTADGQAGEELSARSVEFDILPYAEESTTALTTAAFTNVYTVGAIEVTKVVDGPAEWSTGPFELSMSCTLAGATPNPVYVGTKTLTSPTDLVWTVENLPTGASCDVREEQNGGANSSSGDITLVVGDSNDEPVTGEITNTFTTGSVTVTKALEGEPAASLAPATAGTYTVQLICTRVANGATVPVAIAADGKKTITGAGSVTYADLPTGALCGLTETASSPAAQKVTIEPAGLFTVGEGETVAEVSVTNEFTNGSVAVRKTLSGDGQDFATDTFPATVTCTWQGANVPLPDDGAIELDRNGDAIVFDDIPTGSICSVVEKAGSGATTVTTPSPVTIVEGATAELVIDNFYDVMGFTVTKDVDAGGAVDQDGKTIAYSTVFEFEASCLFLDEEVVPEADRVFELTDGGDKSFEDLPVGSECTVTETETGGAASVTVNGEDASSLEFLLESGEDAQVTAAFVNHYTVGAVEITKQVTGAGAQAWGNGEFVVQLVCTLTAADPNQVYSATHQLSKTDPIWKVENLPTGAECVVSEIDDAGATQSTRDPEDGVITVGVAGEEGEVATVTVTNDFRVGGLNVQKLVDGPGSPTFSNGPFVFAVSCTYEDANVYEGDLRVEGDGSGDPLVSDSITGIPVGSVCVVEETDDGDADATPAPVTITIKDVDANAAPTVVTAAFTNLFSAAGLTLTKNLEGAGAEADYATSAVFTVLVTCQLEGPDESLLTLLSQEYEITGGETIDLLDAEGNPVRMPLGTHCFGEETVTGGATSSVVSPDTYEDGLVVTTDSGLQSLDLVATNTFDTGSLQLSKVVTGSGAAEHASKIFLFALTCSLDQGQDEPTILFDREIVEITGGETITVDDLPIGAECFVAETDAGGATAVEISHSTSAMPAVVRDGVSDSDQAEITVTNTFIAPLPATGVDTQPLLIAAGVAGVLIIGGLVLMLVLRRRRKQE